MTERNEMEEQLTSGGTALAAENAENAMDKLKVIDGAGGRQTVETKKLQEKYRSIGPATALYALFYAFCMYKNGSGITFPFFVAGSLCYFYYTLKKLELTLKRGSAFYGISVMLLAISTFCTDDGRMIALNKTGIFLLMISFLLGQFYHTEKWGLGKFAAAIPGTLLSSLGEVARPVSDMAGFTKKEQSPGARRGFYVLLGVLLTLPLLVVVVALLSSADLIFRQLTEYLLAAVNFENVFGVVFSVILWYFGTYMLLATLCKKTLREDVRDHRSGEPVLAITVTAMLSVVYLIFSVIQILYLFLGKMQLPEGYTYAEYAREGFFQLLAVAILNLIIVLVCMALFRESKILKAVLTVMSLCTFIMIASSCLRMVIYIRYYNLTFLRIIVLWALAVLFLLFLGVVLQIFRPEFPLFRYGLTVVTVFYIGLAFSHPDYLVAKYNLENDGGTLDYKYLAGLSTDAAPVLLPYLKDLGYDLSVAKVPVEEHDTYWEHVERKNGGTRVPKAQKEGFGYYYLQNVMEKTGDMGIRSFNLSRYLALKGIQ